MGATSAEHIVSLRDGSKALIRPIRPEDKAALTAGLSRLSPRSRYRRFLRPVTRLSERELRYLTEIDYADHFAWVAFNADDPADGWGVARYVRRPDEPEVAEAAVAVVDDRQHLGLGTLLLQFLSASAIANGIRIFRGWVLADNVEILRPLARIGGRRRADHGVLQVEVDLTDDFAESPVRQVLRAVAAGRIRVEPSEGAMNPDTLAIDHVILLVEDLDDSAARMLDEHGLAALPGGRHPGHGTGNQVIPLGDAYLELMGVVDAEEAARSPMGRWALANRRPGLHPAALCLRTDDIRHRADGLGLEPVEMTRQRPDGTVLSWSLAGVEETFGPDRLPFFIQWHGDPAHHPGRTPAPHRVRPMGITGIELSGDRTEIERRLGSHRLPVIVSDGAPGVRRVVVATEDGEVVLE